MPHETVKCNSISTTISDGSDERTVHNLRVKSSLWNFTEREYQL